LRRLTILAVVLYWFSAFAPTVRLCHPVVKQNQDSCDICCMHISVFSFGLKMNFSSAAQAAELFCSVREECDVLHQIREQF